MAVIVRKNLNQPVPSLKRTVRLLGGLITKAPQKYGETWPTRTVVVRSHYLTRTGGRKKTLYLGLRLQAAKNKNVLLYKVPQPNASLRYPVFTAQKRRVKSLGVQVAPIIPVGPALPASTDLQHYLGLCFIQLGGRIG